MSTSPEPAHEPSQQPPQQQGDALVVGEALVDVVRRGDDVAEHPGGSPANVALGLARLGRPTRLLTRLVDDERGRRVAGHLRRSGVVLDAPLLPTTAGRTSTAQAQVDDVGRAEYVFDLEWSLPEDVAAGAGRSGLRPRVVFTGSLATVLEPGAAAVEELLRRARPTATVVYDPNLRPTIIGSADEVRVGVEQLVATCDVVKLSDEDAAWLYPARPPEVTAREWLAAGPAVVVLTRGQEGALAVCAAGEVDAPRVVVDVADTVGAGDSFTSALVDGLWALDLLGAGRRGALRDVRPEQLREVVLAATAVAAVTVSRPGADPPTRDELADRDREPGTAQG